MGIENAVQHQQGGWEGARCTFRLSLASSEIVTSLSASARIRRTPAQVGAPRVHRPGHPLRVDR
jgi:hypothetical protein